MQVHMHAMLTLDELWHQCHKKSRRNKKLKEKLLSPCLNILIVFNALNPSVWQGEAHLAVDVLQSFDELNRDCLVGSQRNEQWVFVFVCCGTLMVGSNATLLRF